MPADVLILSVRVRNAKTIENLTAKLEALDAHLDELDAQGHGIGSHRAIAELKEALADFAESIQIVGEKS